MFRRGQWISHDGKLGVIFELAGPEAIIHHVDEQGETVRQPDGGWDVRVHQDDLEPASEQGLPAARRAVSRAEEERVSAELLAAAAPPVPGDLD